MTTNSLPSLFPLARSEEAPVMASQCSRNLVERGETHQGASAFHRYEEEFVTPSNQDALFSVPSFATLPPKLNKRTCGSANVVFHDVTFAPRLPDDLSNEHDKEQEFVEPRMKNCKRMKLMPRFVALNSSLRGVITTSDTENEYENQQASDTMVSGPWLIEP